MADLSDGGMESSSTLTQCSIVTELEMGKNPTFRGRVRFGFFIDGIGKMFPWWSSVTD